MASAAKKRIDPPKRPVTDVARRGSLKNLRSDRHYVKVYKAAPDQGIDYYLDLGYEIEVIKDGGPSLTGVGKENPFHARRPGDPIEHMGHVLMSCPMERKEQIDRYGVDGDGGQEKADIVENRIVDKSKAVDDPMRGMTGIRGRSGNRVFSMQNETSQLEAEEG